MAAGLGFKTFTTGEVLTAADTNGYLMQGVLVFASAAARDAAITSPQEGQCCYLKDTDAVLTYSGAAWVGFDDSNAIQNAIVDAKGDLVAASGADTPARLAVGANDLLLTAASGEATGLKYTGGWTTWTPTFTNFTLGNGTINVARYQQVGKIVNYEIYVTLGSTSSVTGYITVRLPFQAGASSLDGLANHGVGRAFDSSTTLNWLLNTIIYSQDVYINAMNASGTYTQQVPTSSTAPITWATGDFFSVSGSYEVA